MIDFSAFGDDSAASRARRANIAGEIGAACRKTGFFALTGHGIDATEINDAFAMAQNFFDLPEDKKREIAIERSPCHRGWFAHGGEVLDRTKQPQGDYKEGLKIGRNLPPDHARVKAALPLHGANQYPHESGALVGFRAQMDTLYGACEALSRHLMQAFALSLDLQPDHFDRWLSEPMATLSPCATRLCKKRQNYRPARIVISAVSPFCSNMMWRVWRLKRKKAGKTCRFWMARLSSILAI